MFEAIFHLEVLLAQSDWTQIESADRKLRSIFSEIVMLSGTVAGGTVDELIFESATPSEEQLHPCAVPSNTNLPGLAPELEISTFPFVASNEQE